MYVPRSYRIEDLSVLHRFIEEHGFATIFSQTDEGPFATHIPLLLDRSRGPLGTVCGHVARANPHWRALVNGQEALVTFLGPHVYVSPSWYVNPVAVPTWNYATVHARGRPAPMEDAARLHDHVLRMVEFHEAGRRPPWDPTIAADTIERLLPAIVGFEIEITRIEGKFKLSQNRPAEDQAGVASALEQATHDNARAIAALMRSNLERPES